MESWSNEIYSDKGLGNNPWLKQYLARKLETIYEESEEEERSDQSLRNLKKKASCKSRQHSLDSTSSVSTKVDESESVRINLIVNYKPESDQSGINSLKSFIEAKNRKDQTRSLVNDKSTLSPNLTNLTDLENETKKLISHHKKDFEENNYDPIDFYRRSVNKKIKLVKAVGGDVYKKIGSEICEFAVRKFVFSTLSADKILTICKMDILNSVCNMIFIMKKIACDESQMLCVMDLKSHAIKIRKHIVELESFKSDDSHGYDLFKKNEMVIVSFLISEIEKLKENLRDLSSCIDTTIDLLRGEILPFDLEKNHKDEFKCIFKILSDYERPKNNKKKNMKPKNFGNQGEEHRY